MQDSITRLMAVAGVHGGAGDDAKPGEVKSQRAVGTGATVLMRVVVSAGALLAAGVAVVLGVSDAGLARGWNCETAYADCM